MNIPLATLPRTARYPAMVRTIIRSNMTTPAPGKGNRAARRSGRPVVDPWRLRPFGCIAMDRAEIAAMLRTAPQP